MKIPFFRTTVTGDEKRYIENCLSNPDSFSEKKYTAKCENWFKENHGIKNFLLTKSCSHSLELAAIVLGIKTGDEVILPSYAFVACGNAFALRGAKCVYVDIRPDTMNIDETKIEQAITPRTKAIVTLNYASISCNYTAIKKIANENNLYLIEDNAHGILAEYRKGEFLGSFGDISTFSFDHLKNISCGQGGGIAINNESLLENFFIHYEFGTNRRSFLKGKVDRYEWIDLGSNYPLSELNAAILFAQLEKAEEINRKFVRLSEMYNSRLSELCAQGKIELPAYLPGGKHNGHCFYIKTKDSEERGKLIKFLRNRDINAQFHYTPLHNSEYGRVAGTFVGEDRYTSSHSKRLLRLPLYYELKPEELDEVAGAVSDFYSTHF